MVAAPRSVTTPADRRRTPPSSPAAWDAGRLRCGALRIDLAAGTVTVRQTTPASAGHVVSVDGDNGRVYVGEIQISVPDPSLALTDRAHVGRRQRAASACGPTPTTRRDAAPPCSTAPQGIGLCRTEHQFLGDRLPLVRRYLLLAHDADRGRALVELAAAQNEDFIDLLRRSGIGRCACSTARCTSSSRHGADAERLDVEPHEVNPMLGLRGVRLALTRTRGSTRPRPRRCSGRGSTSPQDGIRPSSR